MDQAEALKVLDEEWWSKRHPRRMDVFGDFAGEDIFFVDGNSMLQEIFEDPLVSIGKGSEWTSGSWPLFHPCWMTISHNPTALGFQILHILYLAETFLERLKNQSPNFEVIFFECSC
jgi:hypothetical protein